MTADQLKDLAAWLEAQIPQLEKRIAPELYNHAHFDIYAGRLRDALRVVKAAGRLEAAVHLYSHLDIWPTIDGEVGISHTDFIDDPNCLESKFDGFGGTAIEAIEAAKL